MRTQTYRAALAALGALTAPQLHAQPQELPEVVVSASRAPTEASRTGSAVTVATRADLEATGAVNLVDALVRLPGLAIQQSGGPGSATSLRLRGLAGAYVQVRIDGIDVSDPSGPQVSTPLQLLKTAEVERIEVLRGSQSALYGGQAVAGVISITTRRAMREGVAHEITAEGGSYETASGAYVLRAGTEAAEGAVTLSGFRTSGFSAADEAEGNRETDGSDNLTLSATGEARPAPGVAIGGALRLTRANSDFDGFDNVTFRPADADNTEEATTYAGRLYGRAEMLDGRMTNELALQYFNTRRDSVAGGVTDRFDGDRLKGEWLGGARLADWAGLQFGGDWTRETADVPGLSADSDIYGGFLQLTVEPVDRLTLTFAGRQDEHSEFGGQTTGRATAAVRATETTVLRGSLANGFRAPSLFELFSPLYGNAALTPETSVSWDAGVEQRFLDGRASLSLGYYDIRTDDEISFDFATFRYAQVGGRTRSKGVEVSGVARPLDWLSVAAAYTYADARVEATGARSVRVPRHQASVGVTVTPIDRLSLGADALMVDDLPNGAGNITSYAVFGARAGWQATPTTELFLRADNLLDRQYQALDGYGTSGLAVYAGVRATW